MECSRSTIKASLSATCTCIHWLSSIICLQLQTYRRVHFCSESIRHHFDFLYAPIPVMELNGFSAWITVDGTDLTHYNVEVSPEGDKATCWIPSEAGKASHLLYGLDLQHSSPAYGKSVEVYPELEGLESHIPTCWLCLHRRGLLRW